MNRLPVNRRGGKQKESSEEMARTKNLHLGYGQMEEKENSNG